MNQSQILTVRRIAFCLLTIFVIVGLLPALAAWRAVMP